MALLDSKEHLLKIILTQYGRKKLSEGKLHIAHYAFLDDEIDYEVSSGYVSGSTKPDVLIDMSQATISRAHTNASASYQTGPYSVVFVGENEFRYENRGNGIEGYLVEGDATNLLTNEPLDVSQIGGWTLNNGSGDLMTTSSVGIAPDGTQTAARINMGAATNDRIQDIGPTLAANTEYTVSCWVRAISGSAKCRLGIQDDVAGWQQSSNFVLSENWQRIDYTATTDALATTFRVAITNADDSSANLIYAWGFQCEEGAWPTSLISAAGGIRLRDTITIPAGAIDPRLLSGKSYVRFFPLHTNTEWDAFSVIGRILIFNTGGVDAINLNTAGGIAQRIDGVNVIASSLDWTRLDEIIVLNDLSDSVTRVMQLLGLVTGDGEYTGTADQWPSGLDLYFGGGNNANPSYALVQPPIAF